MNERIVEAYKKIEKISDDTAYRFSHVITPEMDKPTLFYDIRSDDASHEYIIPYERVKRDLKNIIDIIIDFFNESQKINAYDDFITLFASYCNFYIKKGLICRLEDTSDTFFGLCKTIFTDCCKGKLLPYMEEIFLGICKQEYAHFKKAIDIIPEFSVAHLYLFVYYTYCYYDKVENKDQDFIWSALEQYSNLNQEYRKYVYGISEYFKESCENISMEEYLKGIFFDSHPLPYISVMINSKIYHEKTQEMAKACSTIIRGYDSDYSTSDNVSFSDILVAFSRLLDFVENAPYENHPLIQNIDLNVLKECSFHDRYNFLNIRSQIFKNNNEYMYYMFRMQELLVEKQYELSISNTKLKKAIEDKNDVIRGFVHKYGNMQTVVLQDIGKKLLGAKKSPILRELGRKIMMEYSIKENMIKDVEMLQLQFEEKTSRLIKKLRSSISLNSTDFININSIVSDSLQRVFMSLLYDEKRRGKYKRELFFETEDYEEKRQMLQNSFEKNVLIDEQSTLTWIVSEQVMNMSVTVCDEWNSLHFDKDGYAALLLTDWISELINNVIKYSDKKSRIELSFFQKDTLLCIKLCNICSIKNKGLHGSQQGIYSINKSISQLNSTVKSYEKAIITPEHDENEYALQLNIDKSVFIEK